MARARNKVEEVKPDLAEEAILSGDLDLDAIDAVLNGQGDLDLEIEDADFQDVDEGELLKAIDATAADETASEGARDEAVSEGYHDDAEKGKAAEPKTVVAKEGGKPKEKGPSAASIVDDPTRFADEMVKIMGDDEIMLEADAILSEDDFRTVMNGITQKKVRSKALSLMRSALRGDNLEKYAGIGVKLLAEASASGKNLTLEQIKVELRANGYKEGTVSAQSGQLMNLFPSLKMAKRETRGVLEPNPDSVLLDIFSSAA